ncbi:hypothetical protein BGZ70_005873 [Mortierella alpina]|uniref:DUF1308 domain-containing protein n=1 Tax=Mortierella alpina TaxID=64518 RepID=A0A9P6J918_MORAP|nr:hypothetical protein BGZ70_005873 [Mortierella alpina]
MDLLERAQALLQECNDIVSNLNSWKECNPTFDADSVQKILHAEQKFLEKVTSTPAEEIKPVQISSSNVPYLKSLVCALVHSKNPVAIRKTFTYQPDRYSAMAPEEKFKTLPTRTQKGRRGHSVMQLSTSEPLSTSLSNVKSFQVKVDLIADHGKSWLKINAGSVKSLLHEFADMEEDSDDDEQDEDSQDESEDEGEDGIVDEESRSKVKRDHRQRHSLKPIHVSKDTHADMTLLTRSLVLAADQNRLHYDHRPQVTLRFTGIVPEDEHFDAVKNMVQKSVRVGRVAQSMENGQVAQFPVEVVFGSMQLPELAGVSASPRMDPSFAPFSIPETVDDMVLFTKTLHLDITTLMALSSFLCHTIRPDPTLFTSPPLVLQAQQEHEQPLLPLLGKIFEGRERLVMSRTAATRFKSILNVIGGSEEQWRGRVMIHDPLDSVPQEGEEDGDLIRERWVRGSDWAQQYGVFAKGPPRIEVIEDVLGQAPAGSMDGSPEKEADESKHEGEEGSQLQEAGSQSQGMLSLSESSSIGSGDAVASSSKLTGPGRKELNMTELHSKIFMTGYRARLTTVTANLVGYRTVTRTGQVPQGMSVWFHQPRSLAEAKLPAS